MGRKKKIESTENKTIKTVEEVERKLNIPVIGAIPVGGRKHE